MPTRPYFRPIHRQPYFRARFGFREGDFPIAEKLGGRSLALAFSGGMTGAEVEKMVAALRRVVG